MSHLLAGWLATLAEDQRQVLCCAMLFLCVVLWKCERDVGGQYKHSRVAAASPSSSPPNSGSAFLLAKADGDSYTESLKSCGITFLVLLEAAPARAAA